MKTTTVGYLCTGCVEPKRPSYTSRVGQGRVWPEAWADPRDLVHLRIREGAVGKVPDTKGVLRWPAKITCPRCGSPAYAAREFAGGRFGGRLGRWTYPGVTCEGDPEAERAANPHVQAAHAEWRVWKERQSASEQPARATHGATAHAELSQAIEHLRRQAGAVEAQSRQTTVTLSEGLYARLAALATRSDRTPDQQAAHMLEPMLLGVPIDAPRVVGKVIPFPMRRAAEVSA